MIPTFSESLPSEWVEKRLKYAAPLRIERVEATSEHRAYLGLENVQSWTGKLLPTEVDESAAGKDSEGGTANSFQKDDVLFGKLRPYLAKVFHADKGGVSSTEFLVLKPQPEVRPEFLLYSMLSPEFVGLVNASTFGAKMPRANWDFIGSMSIPVPDLDIQQRIANYLDRETAHIDALIAEKERMLTLLEEKRAALISQAVTRGLDPDVALKPSGLNWLGDIPAHWETIRLGYVVTLQGGMTPSKDKDEYWEGNVPWASPKDIKQHSLVDTIDHVSELAVEETGLTLVTPPVLLLVVRGMILAKSVPTTITAVPVTVNQDMKALHVEQDKVMTAFLKLLFDGLRQVLLTLIEESAHGTRCFRTDLLRSFVVPIPPLDEQREIVIAVGEEQKSGNLLASGLIESIELLKERRSALITAAVTGQIDPKDMAA